MKHKTDPVLLMPDMASGLPPSDVQNLSFWRRPNIRLVVADNHPLELEDGDPALDGLIKQVGKDTMREFGECVEGGFRMVELLGLIDDPLDQLSEHIVDDIKPQVPVLPLVSMNTKLAANALVTVVLRALGATIYGPFEQPVFLKPADRLALQELGMTLLEIPGVREIFEDGLWWAEVPTVGIDIRDPDEFWCGRMPAPCDVVDLFLS